MRLVQTAITDCLLVQPTVYYDCRGYFVETFNQQQFNQLTGFNFLPVQDNQSFSSYGVLRGLHGQKPPFAQAKLVQVLQGEILDVVIDLRQQSASFKHCLSTKLTADNSQLYIPAGCLHGFVVLSNTALINYKCDQYYQPTAEFGVKYNDPVLAIDWQLATDKLIISTKDLALPTLNVVLQQGLPMNGLIE